MSKRTVLQRFEEKYYIDANGCWIWTAHTQPNGYGRFRDGERLVMAHRWAYEHHIAPIPEGLQLDHRCRVRNCVNPDHLEPVTTQENTRRGEAGKAQLARTHCPQDHPYEGENLYLYSDGRRACRICARESTRQYRERNRRRYADQRRAGLDPEFNPEDWIV